MGVCVGGSLSLFNLFVGWLVSGEGVSGVGEIVDDGEINVCFLLTRKSCSWVDSSAVLAWFRPRVEWSGVPSPDTQAGDDKSKLVLGGSIITPSTHP